MNYSMTYNSRMDGIADWLTTKEAAQLLGVTPGRILQLIKAGHLHPLKRGRDHFVLRAEVEAARSRPGRGRPRTRHTDGTGG